MTPSAAILDKVNTLPYTSRFCGFFVEYLTLIADRAGCQTYDGEYPKGALGRSAPAEGIDVFTKNHEWLAMVQEQGWNLTGDHEN